MDHIEIDKTKYVFLSRYLLCINDIHVWDSGSFFEVILYNILFYLQ